MKTIEERFLEKTLYAGDCIVWTALIENGGYGRFYYKGRKDMAHRAAYELFVGPIPQGLHIDHLCRNRACVNVAHLRLVTPQQNTNALGSLAKAKMNREKTHCFRGHKLSEENIYHFPSQSNRRHCRICWRARSLASYYRRILQEGK